MTQPKEQMPEEIWYRYELVKANGKIHKLHFASETEYIGNGHVKYIRADLVEKMKDVDGG